MHIAIIAPSDRSCMINFLPEYQLGDLPLGFYGAPLIGILIEELLKQQHYVTAITTTVAINNDYTVKEFRSGNFIWIVVPSRPHSIRMNGRKIGRIVDLYAYEKRIMTQCIKQANPDFVHAHWSYEFADAALKSGIPSLVTIHDNAIEVLKFNKSLFWFFRFVMSEFTLAKVRFASTVSPYMVTYAKRKCLSLRVIANPVVIKNTFTEIIELIDLKIKTISSPRLIMVNNGWDERKNGKVGLLAFKKLLEILPSATLHLYGDASEEGGLAYQDATKIGIRKIFFHGIKTHQEIVSVIKSAHLLIHPALEESFGVVLIEAMSFGVPTVGGQKSGAVPWVINEKRLLIDITKEDELVHKLTEILSNKNLYKDISHSVFKNVAARFSSVFVVNEYLNYYHEIKKVW